MATVTAAAAAAHNKLNGYEFYRKVLGAPKFVIAPMVDQSELAWRMLCRKYGAQLCYTPMYHSNIFVNDVKYRKEALQTCAADRPLIIQFCGNDAQQLLEAALLAQEHCDAIDINLGCPQAIARRGHYGAFLQDEWQLLAEIVSTLQRQLSVPVTCKIRIFEDRQRTIKYAQMLEAAGCQLLTVHGRTREQKGPMTGVADWSYVKELRKHIKIPLFSNGNILGLDDVERCLHETGVDGVMTAEGNLHNPAIFTGQSPPTWTMAEQYLELVEKYPCPASYIRAHMFKLFHHIMNIRQNAELRENLAVANQVAHFRKVVAQVKAKYECYHRGEQNYAAEEWDPNIKVDDSGIKLPPWICQPYIRAAPEVHRQIMNEKMRLAEDPSRVKRQYFDEDGNEISRKRMKKLRRRLRRPNRAESQNNNVRMLECCEQCLNPVGIKCQNRLCRVCCRDKCYTDNCDCRGHGILIKSRRERAKYFTKIGDGIGHVNDVMEEHEHELTATLPIEDNLET